MNTDELAQFAATLADGRGRFDQGVKDLFKKHLGREGSVIELRLIPYLQYVMVNDKHIERISVSNEEREIIDLLYSEGHIVELAGHVYCTKAYWDFMSEVLYFSYAHVK
jgi:hypothetical protein